MECLLGDYQIISFFLFLIAFLYSTVGHAGASGYIAVFTLFGFLPNEFRSQVLMLNVVAALITSVNFYRAGYFRFEILIYLIIFSFPAAAFGSYLELSNQVLSIVIGLTLLSTSVWMLIKRKDIDISVHPSKLALLISGMFIGFLSGVSGTGGGVFLSPLMVLKKWARLKEIAAVSSSFILCNSIAGLISNRSEKIINFYYLT